MKKYGAPRSIVTDGLRAYSAGMNEFGVAAERHEVGGRLNNRAENSHQPLRRRERAMRRFRSRRRCRSSAQFTPRCTTNSIRSAISSRGKSTSRDGLLPWPSGARSRRRSARASWRSRCMSTSLRYLDTACPVTHLPVSQFLGPLHPNPLPDLMGSGPRRPGPSPAPVPPPQSLLPRRRRRGRHPSLRDRAPPPRSKRQWSPRHCR